MVNFIMTSQQPVLCPELATDQHGLVTQDNVASYRLSTFDRVNGTEVNVSCYCAPTYQFKGLSETSLLVKCLNGSWVPPPPACINKDLSGDSPGTNNDPEVSNSGSDPQTNNIIILASCVLAIILIFLLALVIYSSCLSRKSRQSKQKARPRSTSTSPFSTSSSGTPVLQSSWPGTPRAWTYMSVDSLLKDMEKSRLQNPDHSWRDFASISTYTTERL